MRVILFLIFLLLLVGCSEESQSSKVQEQEKEIDYVTELDKLVKESIDNSMAAEKILNLYSMFWDAAIDGGVRGDEIQRIFEIDESQMKSYFGEPDGLGYGGTYKSFDAVIAGIKSYYTDKGDLVQLRTTSENISSKLNELNQVPDEYQNYYDKVLELYLLQDEYISMAVYPTGSLLTFNQTANELSSDIISKKNEIDVIKPKTDTETE